MDCAASIVDLISCMFPYSIDRLKRETSVVPGPKPRIFRNEFVSWEQFLGGTRYGRNTFFTFLAYDLASSDSYQGLGAHQAIIVRDDAARDKIRAATLGKEELIFTLPESKGGLNTPLFQRNVWGS